MAGPVQRRLLIAPKRPHAGSTQPALLLQPALPGAVDDIPDALLALQRRDVGRGRLLRGAEDGGRAVVQPGVAAHGGQADAVLGVRPEDARQQVLHLQRQRNIAWQVVPAVGCSVSASGGGFEKHRAYCINLVMCAFQLDFPLQLQLPGTVSSCCTPTDNSPVLKRTEFQVACAMRSCVPKKGS